MQFMFFTAMIANVVAAFAFIAFIKRFISVSDYEEYCFLRGAGLLGSLVSIFVFFALSSRFGVAGEIISLFVCAGLSILIGGLNILSKLIAQKVGEFFRSIRICLRDRFTGAA